MRDDDGFKPYLFSYNFDGSKWSFAIEAQSAEEAKERVGRMSFAQYDGELMATIPASRGALWVTLAGLWRRYVY